MTQSDAEFCAEKLEIGTYMRGWIYVPGDQLDPKGWAFAGRVIEAMRERGYCCRVELSSAGTAECDLIKPTNPAKTRAFGCGDSAPEAICAAARKAWES